MPARGEGRGEGTGRDRGSEDEARILGQGGVGGRRDQSRKVAREEVERERVAVVMAEGPREAARHEKKTKREMAEMADVVG